MTTVAIAEHEFKSKMDEVKNLIKAGTPIIWIRTHEEARCLADLEVHIGQKMRREMWAWSAAQGLVPFTKHKHGKPTDTPGLQKSNQSMEALQYIANVTPHGPSEEYAGHVFVMRDFHIVLAEPVPRKLRDMYWSLSREHKTIIIVAPFLAHGPHGSSAGLPPTLEKQIVVVDYELPTYDYIFRYLQGLINEVMNDNVSKDVDKESLKNKKQNLYSNMKSYTENDVFEFAKALQGLTVVEIENITSSSIQHCQGYNLKFFLKAKKQIISRGEIVEYVEVVNSMSDIGGLDNAKSFFEDYVEANSAEAKAFGVEPLRGVLLVGVPGTGKSALAKGIGNLWKQPLLRLDVGKVMTGLVGGSEQKMRQVIQQVSAVAPCVLWIDEVEKALSGTKSSNFSDGGTMARVFGTLLTAMEEGLDGVTFVATANDISALPPEFIRRFSEVFFVDLPGPDERKEIFKIHLRKRNFDPKSKEINLDKLVESSKEYTGAEIEKSVKRAITLAFKSKEKKMTTDVLTVALKEIKPISHLMSEKIKKLRSDANGRYRYASSWAETQALEANTKKKEMSLDNLDPIPAERKKVSAEQDTKAERSYGLDSTDDEG